MSILVRPHKVGLEVNDSPHNFHASTLSPPSMINVGNTPALSELASVSVAVTVGATRHSEDWWRRQHFDERFEGFPRSFHHKTYTKPRGAKNWLDDIVIPSSPSRLTGRCCARLSRTSGGGELTVNLQKSWVLPRYNRGYWRDYGQARYKHGPEQNQRHHSVI